MIFHENGLLADNSHEISYLIFGCELGKMSQNLSSVAVVIGTLRVKAKQPVFSLIGWIFILEYSADSQIESLIPSLALQLDKG